VGQVLESAGFEVVGSTTFEARALQLLREHQPDALILEPEALTSAMSLFLAAANSASPGLKAVAVSTVDDPETIRTTLQSGTWAYVLKQADPEDIAGAVRQAFSHSIHFAHTLERGDTANATVALQPNSTALSVLTRRELEILVLVTEGKSNSAMARELWVTEQTVKFHLSNIYRKLEVANRTAASRWAHEHGIESAASAAGRLKPA
jgi:DNA-binding NarL/FixJ family response regulator